MKEDSSLKSRREKRIKAGLLVKSSTRSLRSRAGDEERSVGAKGT